MQVDLSTVDGEGHRKWVYPLVSRGSWYRRRLVVAVVLIAFLMIAPWVSVGGKQALFFDLVRRKIDFFGMTFWVNETLVFLSFIIAFFAFILLVTALFGRVYCGWACPFTVFQEFVFRPIEHFLEGAGLKQKAFQAKPLSERWAGTVTKWTLFTFVSFAVSNTFIAYLFGSQDLVQMVSDGPAAHMASFVGVLIVTALMIFQYGWFREQICVFVCPYGRLQSVLLDRNSLIVAYDERRGEPRGRPGDTTGDCVDCKMCVKVCPTGIDIREGLQLECIHCTQCIDACDDIMGRHNRASGLIRYQTENEVEGVKQKILRPRLAIYSIILLVASAILFGVTASRIEFSATVHRERSRELFTKGEDGLILNEVHLQLINKSEAPLKLDFRPIQPASLRVVSPTGQPVLAPDEKTAIHLILKLPPEDFSSEGFRLVRFEVVSGKGSRKELEIKILGPEGH